MKIGIEAQRIFRPNKHGMDIVVLETIRQLQKIDTENEYVIFVNHGPDNGCLQETANCKIVEFGGPYPVWEQIKLPRLARQYGCEVLHCTSNTAPVFCKVPLVVTVHDIIYLETNPLFEKNYTLYQRFGNLYRRFVVRRNLKQARKVITVSNFEKNRFHEKLNLADEKLQVVYNGVGEHFFVDPMDGKNSDTQRKDERPYLLFLGNTAPKKNTPRVLQAFGSLVRSGQVNHKLVVTDLDNQRGTNLLNKLDLEDCKGSFEFVGYVSNPELPALMGGADVFLYPSLRESFGIPILESMAAGTPVITSSVASMPEVAGDAAVLVNPQHTDEISTAIRRLLGHPELRNDLIKRGFKQVESFTWKNTAQQVLNLYREVGAEKDMRK